MVKYEVIFGYNREVVEMEEKTTDYDSIIDKMIDEMEARGITGCFVPYEETLESGNPDGVHEDEYITGGNHGLLLYHGGNLQVNLLKED